MMSVGTQHVVDSDLIGCLNAANSPALSVKTQTLQTDQQAKTSDTIRSGSLAFRCGVIVHSIMRYMQLLVGPF